MEKAFVYILHSKELGKFYIGSTELDPKIRRDRHVSEYYGDSKYTSKVSDWELYYELECCCRQQAMQIEKHIKKMKSKIYIKNLVSYPEIGQKLLERYK